MKNSSEVNRAPETKPLSPPFLNILIFLYADITILKRSGDREMLKTHVIQHVIRLPQSIYEIEL